MKATQAEFDLYVKKASKAIEAARTALAGRLVREMTRERESWWKEESSKVRNQVAAEVDGDAVYKAFRALAGSKGQAAAEAMWRRGVVAEVPPLETFKTAARDLVESQQTKDLEPHRYLVAQRTQEKIAREALAKTETGKAADAIQKSLLNHFLYREAIKARGLFLHFKSPC